MSGPGEGLRGLVARLVGRRELRYLVVGGWNTAFGYVLYVVLLYLFQPRVHYMVIALVGNILAITMSYATQKLFVFRTRGNILREYVRFYGVYGLTTVLGLVSLPILVEVLGVNPYYAPLLIMAVTTVVTYLGHKNFSFR